MNEIVIGKFTLESLTNGMYSSPLDLYREYVQNSVDSIDDAINKKIIKREEAQIEIRINEDEKSIFIIDNGLGISFEKASKVLLDIGNSEKERTSNRGFRGIGRLSGLGYCKRLCFITSYLGERKKTIIEFNAELLKSKLRCSNSQGESIIDVLNAVTNVIVREEKESKHYFQVVMEGVDDTSRLVDSDYVKEYLVQNLPLPYKKDFHWGTIIEQKIKTVGYQIPSYCINFNDGKDNQQLFKCYENSFVSDRVKKYVKNVDDIEIIPFQCDEKLMAVLWYAKAEYSGTLLDEHIKGIRIRQGNLLIGDKNTANQYFKEERFNGWLLGELLIVNDALIPNARRDDFEETEEYLSLKSMLTEWSMGISKEIRKISLERSASAEKKKAIESVSDEDENGLIFEELGFTDEDDEISGEMDESSVVANNELLDRFQILLGNKGNTFKYKVLNLRSDIPNDQRKMLEKVFDVLYVAYSPKKAEKIAEDIVKNY